jgi:predicted ATPase
MFKETIVYRYRTRRQRIIAFSGTGGTGKTSTLRELSKELTKYDLPHIVLPSVSRKFFAWRGLHSEADFTALPPKEKIVFQHEMFNYYLQDVNTSLETLPEGVKLLCDRTAFDHFAYMVYSGIANLESYKSYTNRMHDYMQNVSRVFFFPYPTLFTQNEAADDFRNSSIQYNVIISALIEHHARKIAGSRCSTVRDDTLDNRVKSIFHTIVQGSDERGFCSKKVFVESL